MLGQVPKWTKGADCKSVAIGFQGSNPCLPTIETSAEWRALSAEIRRRGVVSLLSTDDSVLGTDKACGRSSVVEFQPSKLAVRGSNPLARSILEPMQN